MAKNHPFHTFKLKNKLPVYLYEIPSLMSLHMILFTRVGAVYESPKERGLSHLVEHLPFLGTDSFPGPLKLSKKAQSVGASYNAWTSRNNTRYWLGLPSKKHKEGIKILSDFVFNPLNKKGDVEKEKSVIVSEFNDFWHNPDRRFSHVSWQKRFKEKEHPYSYRPLGIPETVNTFSKKDVEDWRNKYYNTKNMFLVAAGNIKKEPFKRALEEGIGKKESGEKMEEPKFDKDGYSKFTTYHQKEKRPQISFIVSFPSFGWANAGRAGRIKLNFLSYILGRGQPSRLHQRLRDKERLVYRVKTNTSYEKWMGDISISGSVPKEKLLKAMKATKEELDKLITKGIKKEELDLARSFLNANTQMEFDNPFSIAYFFGGQILRSEDIWFPEDYIEKGSKIKVKDLTKLAKELIDYKKINLSFMGDLNKKELAEVKEVFKT